jgi:hypothetical protein
MVRKFIVAAALAAGGFAFAPAPASADIAIGVGVGPGYGYGYTPVYHRGYRHGYYRPWRPRPYGYRSYYAPRPYYARPRCRVTTTRYWNGYRYVVRTREVCGRRYY